MKFANYSNPVQVFSFDIKVENETPPSCYSHYWKIVLSTQVQSCTAYSKSSSFKMMVPSLVHIFFNLVLPRKCNFSHGNILTMNINTCSINISNVMTFFVQYSCHKEVPWLKMLAVEATTVCRRKVCHLRLHITFLVLSWWIIAVFQAWHIVPYIN